MPLHSPLHLVIASEADLDRVFNELAITLKDGMTSQKILAMGPTLAALETGLQGIYGDDPLTGKVGASIVTSIRRAQLAAVALYLTRAREHYGTAALARAIKLVHDQPTNVWHISTLPYWVRIAVTKQIPPEIDTALTWVDSDGRVLADRIEETRATVRDTLAKRLRNAVAQRRSPVQAAREIVKYVVAKFRPKPNAQGTYAEGVRPGQITEQGTGYASYPARRVGRFELLVGFEQILVRAADASPDNPMIQWKVSNAHRGPDECTSNAHRDSGFGPGVYPPREVPASRTTTAVCARSTSSSPTGTAIMCRRRMGRGIRWVVPSDLISRRLDGYRDEVKARVEGALQVHVREEARRIEEHAKDLSNGKQGRSPEEADRRGEGR